MVIPKPKDKSKDQDQDQSKTKSKAKDRRAPGRGGGSFIPLTPEELRVYQGQRLRLHEIFAGDEKHLRTEYEIGLYYQDVQQSGYWRRDPANQGRDFLFFLADSSGRPGSRSTCDRRVRLVTFYTLDKALELHRLGVDLTALVECTYGSPELHPFLLEMAKRGVPIWQIIVARQTGNQQLKLARKKKKAKAQKVEEPTADATSEAVLAMQQKLVELQKEQAEERAQARAKKEREKKRRAARGQGIGADGDDEGDDDLAATRKALLSREAELLERERQVALREQGVSQKMEEIDQKAAELELQSERLKLRAEVGLGALGEGGGADLDAAIESRMQGVKAELARVAEQQERLKDDKKKLALWQVQTEQQEQKVQAAHKEIEAAREDLASAHKELDARRREIDKEKEALARLQKEAEAVAARLREIEQREQEVAAQVSTFAQREQDLARQAEEFGARIKELGGQETQIAGRLQEVVTREQLLQTEQEVLEEDRRKMKVAWESLNRRHFELERRAILDNRIEWTWPWSMDDALNQATGCLMRAQKMAIFLLDELEYGKLPEVGGAAALFDVAEALAEAHSVIHTTLEKVGQAYARSYPEKMERVMKLREEGKRGTQLPTHQEIGPSAEQSEKAPDINGIVGKGRCPLCGAPPPGPGGVWTPPSPGPGPGGTSGSGGSGGSGSSGSGGGQGTKPSGASTPTAPAGGTAAKSKVVPFTPTDPPVPMIDPAVILGTNLDGTPQVGFLGINEQGQPVAVCGNEIQSIIICGQQNFGKSVTAQILAEMLADEHGGISKTPKPLGVMVAHYDHGGGYPSSFAKILGPNPDPQALAWLRKTFGLRVRVKGAKRLKIYVPPNLTPRQMEQRQREYPGAEVIPLKLNMASLKSVGVRLIMGAVGNDALYIKKLEQILSKLGDDPTLDRLEASIDATDFLPRQRQLIKERLDFLRDYVTDGPGIVADLRPGDVVIFDLRHDFLDKDTALALFAVLMDAHAEVKDDEGNDFNKVFVFDEAHKFMSQSSPIREQVGNAIKEMRHRHTWVIIATQDPRCVPKDVTALSSLMIIHRISDRDMLKELQKRNVAWEHTTIERLATLGQAEAEVVANRATKAEWTQKPHRVRMRPPCTAPGGSTRTAV